MKILKVSISLTKNGFTTTISEYEASEKKLIYTLTRTLDDGFEDITINKRIPKEDLMVLKSTMNQSTNFIGYYIYTFPEDIDEATDKIRGEIIKTLKNFNDEINLLLDQMIKSYQN